MSQRIFLILFLFLLKDYAFAEKPLEVTITQSSVYTFRFGADNLLSLNNYFIKEIARYNYLNLYKANYQLDFELDIKILEKANGDYEIQTDFSKQKMEGDIYYEKFNLADVLIPSVLGFDMLVKEGSKEEKIHFAQLNTDQNKPFLLDSSSIPKILNPEFSISNIELTYTDEDIAAFESRITSINYFLALNELLDFNFKKAKQINPDDTLAVLSNYIKIYDIKRFKEILEEDTLNFDIPETFRTDFDDNHKKINAQFRRLENIIEKNTDTLDVQISTEDLAHASQTILDLQFDYLEAMSGTNHLFEPGYLSVSDFFNSTADWQKLEDEIGEKLLKKSDISNPENILSDLSKKVYADYCQNADSLIAGEDFTEALLLMSNAKTLCTSHPDADCELFTFYKISEAKYGIYDAYLRVANTAMEKQNLNFAYQYFMLARDFQKQNQGLIISSGAVDSSLENLAWAFVESGKQFLDVEEPNNSLASYIHAREIYQLIDVHTYDDLVEKQISKILLSN